MVEKNSIDEVRDYIENSKGTPETIVLAGKSGMGQLLKTKELAGELGMEMIAVDVQEMPITDAVGTDERVPGIIERVNQATNSGEKGCILIVDGHEDAGSDLRTVFKNFLSERTLSGHKIPNNTFIVVREEA